MTINIGMVTYSVPILSTVFQVAGTKTKNGHPGLPYMYICVALIHGTIFIFTLYRPQDDGIVMFDRISETINNIIPGYLSVSFHICGNFNICHKEWLVHANKTDEEGSAEISPSTTN